MLRGSGQAGQNGHTVMARKLPELGIEFWIGKIELEHRRLEVVQIDRLGDSAQMAEGILQAANQRLGVLMTNRFAVALARVAQYHSENPGFAFASVTGDKRRTGPKVHVDFLARGHFDPP